MSEIFTMAEMKRLFDAEWILVEDPETDESLEVRRGAVSYHSKDRDEVYRQAIKLRPERFAILYTGKLPDNTAVIL
jgi:hypothetical protein